MIKEFLEYQRTVKNLSQATIEGYGRDLQEFVTYAAPRGWRWSTMSSDNLDEWVTSLHEIGQQPATICRKIASCKQLTKWAYHHGLLRENPFQFNQSPKRTQKVRHTADVEAIDMYLRAAHTTYEDIVISGFVSVLLETGVRLSEALNIKGGDIDPEKKRIKIYGKGAKERYVYYGTRSAVAIAHLYESDQDTLFPAWSPRQYRRLLDEKVSKYTGHIHPHMLRHSMATANLNNGMPIEALSKILGHAKIETTQIYATLADKQTRELYKQYSI